MKRTLIFTSTSHTLVEEHPKIANIVVDRDGADGFAEVPPTVWVVCCLLLIVGIEGVFASFLEVKNVSADHILIDLIHASDTLFFLASFLKQTQGLFVRKHRFFP